MADAQRPPDKARAPLKTKLLRSQKIIQLSPTEDRPQDIPEDSELPLRDVVPSRSHTPGHLSTKSQDRKKKASELASRSRSQSLSKTGSSSPSASKPTSQNGESKTSESESPTPSATSSLIAKDDKRPLNLRSTSAIAPKASSASPAPRNNTPSQQHKLTRGPHIPFPPFPDPTLAPDVQPAPASSMYWSKAPVSGAWHTSLRAHTTTLIGSNIYIFGGCDSRSCFNELYVLDADAFHWSCPYVCGETPVPLRAMTCTAVGKKLIVFGGGDGPAYYNDIYVLDTTNFRWSKPRIGGDKIPSKRRAHTACLYKNGIYVFGGGDGVRALNDVWRLDVSDVTKMSWKLISAPSTTEKGSVARKDTKPKARGYHTANMVGSKLIIFGGSDGGECFRDVWVFDVETLVWRPVSISVSYPRLSHTATIVGSYLFVIGGHDGVEYSNEVLLLNLVTMVWDKRKIYGNSMSGRGYHGCVLHDSRLFITGGFDGVEVFGDVYLLEMAVHAYYSQISHFSIDV
ncbi:putative host cell factor 2 [Coleophoma cylindrospora]|uniref:Putative host cell factor 2 n=1 Tax=Coleophoma cylindrospora TaxID=1849047 RepID=A0A3D8RGJ7_9HELO|nr:putative host cell factor 2 [Coleophoma cylindrospora]